MRRLGLIFIIIASTISANSNTVKTDGSYSIKNTEQFKTGTHNVYGKHYTVITSKSTTVSMKGEAQLQCEAKKPTYETHGEWVVNGTERCYDEVKRRTDYYWDASGQICTSNTEVYDSQQYMCQPDPETTCLSQPSYQTTSTKDVDKGSQICKRTTTYNNTYSWDGSSCLVNTAAISYTDSSCQDKYDPKAECESKPSYTSKELETRMIGSDLCVYEHNYNNSYTWQGNVCNVVKVKTSTIERYCEKNGTSLMN